MAQEDCKFKAIMENLVKVCLKIKVKKELGLYLSGARCLSGARA